MLGIILKVVAAALFGPAVALIGKKGGEKTTIPKELKDTEE